MNFALANLKSASVEGWKRWSLTCEKGVEAWRFVFFGDCWGYWWDIPSGKVT
jgi:hypothetical protein